LINYKLKLKIYFKNNVENFI
jgi:hypothetical protein